MDLYGNLTELSEFDGNRQIRLVSYLDPGVAIGVTGQEQVITICDIANDDVTRTMWRAQGGGAGFTLESVQYPGGFLDQNLFVGGNNAPPMALRYAAYHNDPDQFWAPMLSYSVTFVDSCWFTLSFLVVDDYMAAEAGYVFDCSESDTTEGNPILLFPPNGGDNQKWRATIIGPGFPDWAP